VKYDLHKAPVYFQDSHACPYFLDGRISTIEYLMPEKNELHNFHEYLAGGYRRIGQVLYRNLCKECSECIPIRLEVQKFKLSTSHRRTLNKNLDVRIDMPDEPGISLEKIALYENYVTSKHPDNKSEEPGDPINTLISIHHGYQQIMELDYYLEDKLIGVGIVDEGIDAISSNYFYYDTRHLGRRPGILSIIKEIELARVSGKKYYYLGFYIEENPKMSYKKDFRPNQIFVDGKWIDFVTDQPPL
jgi:arginine-tRNA-protein transferase